MNNMADNEIVEETKTVVDADNENDVEFTDTSKKEEPVKSEDITLTKSFAHRLKEETLKISKAKEDELQKKLNSVAAKRGFKDWEELDSFTQNESLKEAGIVNPEVFSGVLNEAIEKNPVVAQAKRIIEEQKEKEQKDFLLNVVKEVHDIDPDINTIEDILKSEKYDEIYKLVGEGYSIPNAYKIVEFDKLASKRAEAAAQNVRNNISNKGHIKTVEGASSKEVAIPEEVLLMYKTNTKMSDQEIREHYTKFVGGNL